MEQHKQSGGNEIVATNALSANEALVHNWRYPLHVLHVWRDNNMIVHHGYALLQQSP